MSVYLKAPIILGWYMRRDNDGRVNYSTMTSSVWYCRPAHVTHRLFYIASTLRSLPPVSLSFVLLSVPGWRRASEGNKSAFLSRGGRPGGHHGAFTACVRRTVTSPAGEWQQDRRGTRQARPALSVSRSGVHLTCTHVQCCASVSPTAVLSRVNLSRSVHISLMTDTFFAAFATN